MKIIPSAPPEPVSVGTAADPGDPAESFSVQQSFAPAEPVPTAEVVAPYDLEEGSLLDVVLNGQVRTVVVPGGGVVMGDTFEGEVLPLEQIPPEECYPEDLEDETGQKFRYVPVPTGRWRDDFCSCCIKPLVCCFSCFCGPVVLGQVMTRLHLDLFGCHGGPLSRSMTCLLISAIFLVYMVFSVTIYTLSAMKLKKCVDDCLAGIASYNSPKCAFSMGYSNQIRFQDAWRGFYSCLDRWLQIAVFIMLGYTAFMILYIPFAMCLTRLRLRNKYNIPGSGCLADLCCSFWFPCCTVSQMARHTNDYDRYPVACCSGDCFNRRGQTADARQWDMEA